MKIKDVTKQTGLTERTIRYYESRELICPVAEKRNGKLFREYSDSDVAQLAAVAALRKSLFSIEQIRRMKEEPEDIVPEFERYKAWLRSEKENLDRLIRAADAVDPAACPDIYQLAHQMNYVAQDLPLPARDIKPNFGRFDPETPQERLDGYIRFERWYRFHRLKALIPVGGAVILLAAATLVVMLCQRQGKIDGIYDSLTVNAGDVYAKILISDVAADPQQAVDISGYDMRLALNDYQEIEDCAAALVDGDGQVLMKTGNAMLLYDPALTKATVDVANVDSEYFFVIDGEGTTPAFRFIDMDRAFTGSDIEQLQSWVGYFGVPEKYSTTSYLANGLESFDLWGEAFGQTIVFEGVKGYGEDGAVLLELRDTAGEPLIKDLKTPMILMKASSDAALGGLGAAMEREGEYSTAKGLFTTSITAARYIEIAGQPCRLVYAGSFQPVADTVRTMLPVYGITLIIAAVLACLMMTRGDTLSFRVGRIWTGRTYINQVIIQGKDPDEVTLLSTYNGGSNIVKKENQALPKLEEPDDKDK